jgi:class 3 adenylate cyclase/pimeloyl-ACP methyl ester carboxylesterase
MEAPVTHYAESNGSLIAYQVFGRGEYDLVLSLGLASNCDHIWDVADNRRALETLARQFRVINFDRRGSGHSDPMPQDALPTWEEWTDDLLTVMDAAGSNKAVVHGERDGGIMAMLFAAAHPERVRALSLGNTTARYIEADDYPVGMSEAEAQRFLALFRSQWGSEELARVFSPNYNDQSVRMSARLLRGAATPRQAAAHFRYMFDIDARPVLSSIQVPTLVLHRSDNAVLPVAHGRYVAEHIPGARFLELPGAEPTSLFSGDRSMDAVTALVNFVTGSGAESEPSRALLTVVFCDIVDSTGHAARLSDQGWHELLERFYALVRGELASKGGTEVDTAGDGIFMSFDRPTRAIRCAAAIRDAVADLDLQVRCGVHTGDCIVTGGRLTGMAVHVGARIAAAAAPGEVWASDTVKALALGSGVTFEGRGTHKLKGVPDSWTLWAVA